MLLVANVMQASGQTTDRWMRKLWQRVGDGWRTTFSRGDMTALLLALGALIMPALSLNAAVWTEGLEQLVPVVILSALFGFLLARSHYNELVALLMSSVYGIGFIGLITALNMGGGTLTDRFYDLATRVAAWIVALFNDQVSQDNLVFVLFLSVLFWFLGHNSAWHIFRIDRVWRVIIPPGLIGIVNIFYYTGDAPLGGYMAVYAVFALLLIVRSTIEAREWEWYANRIRFPSNLRSQFLRWGAVLAILLVGVAWVLPNGAENENLQRVQEFLNSDPLSEINELFNRLFADIESEGLVTADYYGGNSLQLGGSIQLGDGMVMLVDAPPLQNEGTRYYWRSRIFGHYESGRWTPTSTLRLGVPAQSFEIVAEPTLPDARRLVEQRFTIVLSASRLIYVAPQPALVNLPIETDLSYVDDTQTQMDVSVIRPQQVLRTDDTYTASSLVLVAEAPALRAASTDYPQWVRDTYLQVGRSITQRTRDLTLQIVIAANAQNPYDQAKAIERWLRANIAYNEIIPGPPPGHDPVDWILFEDQRGYCNYYASAMIMMLRSLGVPARMAAGFSQGEWDNGSQTFLVRERDAHTWVEAYFPGYGWVEFEPTAAQAPLDRPDVQVVAQDASSTPPPTNTPPSTPTPIATPTELPTSTPESGEGPAPVIPPTVTMTPTATATPFVAAAPAPPEVQETQPEDGSNILSSILTAVLVVMLILFALLALAVLIVFLVWWIEWRGLGGLSPVQRAYALLERYAGYIGVHFPRSYTPHERRRTLENAIPRGDKSIRVITDMYVDEQYGPQRPRGRKWAVVARNAWKATRNAFFRKRIERFIPRRWR